MLSHFSRRALTAVSVLSCLAAARPANADDTPSTVRIQADENLEVFARTDQVTSIPVRYGRYGMRMERAAVYSPVCTHTPCSPDLADGTYYLGLSKGGGNVVEADAPVALNGSATLHATYHDRSVWRGLGIVTAVVAPLAGTAIMFAGSHSECVGGSSGTYVPGYGMTGETPCTSTLVTKPASVGAGGAIILVGLVASLAMVLQHDSAEFSIGPYTIGAAPGARESGVASALPSGLEATLRF